jgi:hypothetical protein
MQDVKRDEGEEHDRNHECYRNGGDLDPVRRSLFGISVTFHPDGKLASFELTIGYSVLILFAFFPPKWWQLFAPLISHLRSLLKTLSSASGALRTSLVIATRTFRRVMPPRFRAR